MDRLVAFAAERGVTLRTGFRAVAIDRTGTGYGVRPATGEPVEARAVVLATGGFAAGRDMQRRFLRREHVTIEELLTPFIVNGKRVAPPATLAEMRSRRSADVAQLDPGVRRLINPHIYHVSLTPELWELKRRLIDEARESLAR